MTEEEIDAKYKKNMAMLQFMEKLSKSAPASFDEHEARLQHLKDLVDSVAKLRDYELMEFHAQKKAKSTTDDEDEESSSKFNFDWQK